MTGIRLIPLDLRRARGAHGSLMRTLTEEPRNHGSERWRDLTSALDRHAVGDALNALPDEQKQLFKLAYFGGLSNREIADRLGLRMSGVRRRLRQALATVSVYVERGRTAGSKVVYALLAWIAGRWLFSTQRWSGNGVEQMVRAGMVVAAGVTVGAVLGTAQSPAQLAPIGQASIPAMRSMDASAVQAPATVILAAAGALPNSLPEGVLVQRSGVPSLPVEVNVPGLPNLPQTVPVAGLPNSLDSGVPSLPISLTIPAPAVPALPKL
jgi:sigma-70-like protein